MKKLLIFNVLWIFILMFGMVVIKKMVFHPKVFLEVTASFPQDTELLVSCLYDSGIYKVFDKDYNQKKKQGFVSSVKGGEGIKTYRFDISSVLPNDELLTGLWFEWKKVDGIIRFKFISFKSFLSTYHFSSDAISDNFDTWRSQMVSAHGILYFKPGGINWMRWKRWWVKSRQEKMKQIYSKVQNGYKKNLSFIYILLMVILAIAGNFWILRKNPAFLKFFKEHVS